ncbi:MAG: PIN domain-containing protein [Bacteroidota bacterium]|nr:PIN domain-containing protein [Bacteroidota bacterium]
MMKKYFVDSNIIIESCKRNLTAIDILSKYEKDSFTYINPIVVSEVSYILKKKLKYSIKQIEPILNEFSILPVDKQVVTIAYDYMHKYNMKPNDAMIAATCKYHEIPNILTMDNDFEQVCTNENITLLN